MVGWQHWGGRRRALRGVGGGGAGSSRGRQLTVAALLPLSMLGATSLATSAPAGATGSAILYVATNGSDAGANACTSSASPCATVSQAVSVAATGDTIEVAGTVHDNVTVPSSLTSLTIAQWPGQTAAVMDGTVTGAAGTVLSVARGAKVAVNGITLENGSGGYGGGIANAGTLTVTDSAVSDNESLFGGAGIYNVGTLTVTGSTVDGNRAVATPGGGIYSGGSLTVTDSTVSGNVAIDTGGGIANTGGSLTVIDSTVSGNSAGPQGGGITTDPGTTTITGSTITGNSATDLGGGVYANAGSTLTVSDSTVSENLAADTGGGIAVLGTLYLTDSTVSGNHVTTAGGSGGGGIFNKGQTTVTASTISGNTAVQVGGGIFSQGQLAVTDSTLAQNTTTRGVGAGIANAGAAVMMQSTVSGNTATAGVVGGIANAGSFTVGATIVAGNKGGGGLGGTQHNCGGGRGTVVSAGYNLTDDATGSACAFTQPTDVVGADPELGPLQDNGGPTPTMAPAAGGPATGQIPLGTALNGLLVCPGTDQRGVARPQPSGGSACTIGAVEALGRAAPTITSASGATFTVGRAGSLQLTASAYPAATFAETGPLPSGVTLSPSGLLSGTPAAGTSGAYALTITASNGITPRGTQAFTLTVIGPPAAPAVTSAIGGTGTLTVTWSPPATTGGTPLLDYVVRAVPTSGQAVTRFVASTTTTATLSGLPAGTTYAVTVTAGNAQGQGPTSPPATVTTVAAPIRAVVSTPGYWLASPEGKVTSVGTAPFLGDLGNEALDAPIVAMASTPDHKGYWLVAADGGIFAFGDAAFYGSMGGAPLNAPIVGLTPTSDGHGYWLVASDGGIFAFGDAQFHGSMGGRPLNAPVVAMAADRTGQGYWLVAADGGVFTFGAPGFYGSMGGKPLNAPVIAMDPTSNGHGYWLVAADGGVFSFGDAAFSGSLGGHALTAPVVAALFDPAGGYWLVSSKGTPVPFGTPTLPAQPVGLTVSAAALFTA